MNKPVPLKILVVDDTEATQYALARVLIKDGFEVRTASTGKEALQLVEEFFPDLVTLDIHLPDMSGFEVCQKIKSKAETAHIAVLQISASYVTSSDRIFGLDGGADGYLTHPVEGAVLIATIRALLRLRSMGESLRESEERLRLAIENTQLGTWEFSPQTKVLKCSEQCQAIFGGLLHAENTYENYLRTLHPEDLERQQSTVEQVLNQSKKDFISEHRIILPSGEIRWVLGRGAAHYKLVNGREELSRVIGTVLDITDRKQVLIDLQAAKEAAEVSNHAKTQFIANISHEIRTPLGAILGFADLVSEGDDLSEEKRGYMKIIQRNALQLSQLIDEILDLSKVEADKMAIERIPFNFMEMVDDLISVFKMKAQEKSLSLDLVLEGDIPKVVTGDPTRWRQILINLLNNAIKFTERGAVAILMRLHPSASEHSENVLEIDITDTGIGVSESQAKKLFQPFVQADNSMTRRYGGTGLGLSLSRKLARAMDGDLLLLHSEPGRGTTFRLRLNAGSNEDLVFAKKDVDSAGQITSEQTTVDNLRLKDLKILVVEDAKDNQIILERILSRSGASVEMADHGSEGVQKAQSKSYDIVLMDIQMPGMDGYQAVATLRTNNYQKPVIALTAHALKGERERCLEAGFSDYLTKPIDRELLITKIVQACP